MRADPEPAAAREGFPYFLDNLLLFIQLLRRAGLRVSVEQSLDLARALSWVDLVRRSQVFHTARSLLVTRREDLALFEAIFERFWRRQTEEPLGRGQKAPRAPRHQGSERPFTVVSYMAYKARHFDQEIEVGDRSGTFSDEEILQRKDFSRLTPEELDSVRRLLRQMGWQAGERLTRRWAPSSAGRAVDLRQTLRRAARLGSVPARLPRRRRKVKPRPLVLIADVSGSMEKYSRLFLQFFHAVSQSSAAASQGKRSANAPVESFVFGTRLTRITAALRLRNVDRALEEAAQQVADWAGGTRIADCLGEFNRRWGRRVLRRGAVVLILSDGWERGDAGELRRQVRHLQLRCHRLIWLNPLVGRRGYQPLVAGMAAAVDHVDDFLPVHDLHSLQQLADHLRSLPRRRTDSWMTRRKQSG